MQPLLFSLFGTSNLSEVSIGQLNQLVEQYPSFQAAHLLLSKKLKQEGSQDFQRVTQRTALYFNNPFWLQWLLLHQLEDGVDSTSPEFSNREMPLSDSLPPELESHNQPPLPQRPKWEEEFSGQTGTQEDAKPEPLSQVDSTISVGESKVDSIPDSNQLRPADDQMLAATTKPEVAPLQTQDRFFTFEDTIPSQWAKAESLSQEISEELMLKSGETELEISSTPDEMQTDLAYGPPTERPLESSQDQETNQRVTKYFWQTEEGYEELPVASTPAPVVPGQELADETKDHSQAVFKAGRYFWQTDQPESPAIEAKEATPEVASDTEEPENLLIEASELAEVANEAAETAIIRLPNTDASVDAAEKETNAVPALETSDVQREVLATIQPAPAEAPPNLEASLIEPYHTIDYFASQGIRYIPEENPSDRFAKQLKSFTAWLKTMKKLPLKEVEEGTDVEDKSGIQAIAEHSNEEKEILTETMAEVLIKQGKQDKAMELYRKLSLLDPAKSTYFAVKIDELKK